MIAVKANLSYMYVCCVSRNVVIKLVNLHHRANVIYQF